MSVRKGDMILVICQKNAGKKLVIEEADEGLENAIGYSLEELLELDLRDILPDKINEHIDDYLEFEENGHDLADILVRERNFAFVTKLGQEAQLDMRISHTVSMDDDIRYQMIVHDASEKGSGSGRILQHLQGHQQLERVSGLPDEDTFNRDAEFINFCVEKERLHASFALISIDQLDALTEEHGAKEVEPLIREVADRCRQNFRADDILAFVEGKYMVAILLEARKAEALVPLNRLRWQVANKPLEFELPGDKELDITLSVIYDEVGEGKMIERCLDACKVVMEEVSAEGGNAIKAL